MFETKKIFGLKKYVLVLAAVLLSGLFFSGCTEQDASGNPLLGKPFVGGTTGLNTYLIEGMPPPTIHDAGTFPFGVGIMIENKGEADVGPGTDNPFALVKLEGFNPSQLGVTDNEMRQVLASPIRGARRNFDGTIFPGEITTVSFEPLAYLPDIRGNNVFTMRAVLCYDYETFSTATICLKDDILDNIQDTSICSLSGEKSPQNSGGPLQITSLVQNPMAQNKIQVNFVIEHVGIGEFFGRPVGDDWAETCDFNPRNYNKYFVDVEVEPFESDDGYVVSCSRFGNSNVGRVKLYQGAPATISCVIERTRPSYGRIFQDLLNIKLSYRYGQFIETPIIIQDVTN